MPPDGRSTNIRVFIKWDDQTVFAGEDIRCHITFKNVAPSPSASQQLTPNRRQPSQSSPRSDRTRQPSPLLSPRAGSGSGSIANGSTPPGSARSHRSTLSLNVPSTGSRLRNSIQQWPPMPQPPPPTQASGHAHKRSLSIVSMGSNATVDEHMYTNGAQTKPQRPGRGHGRSASLQIIPRNNGTTNGPPSAALPRRSPFSAEGSPVFNNHSFPPSKLGTGQGVGTLATPSTPGFNRSPTRRKPSGPMADFKFPMTSTASSGDAADSSDVDDSATTPTAETMPQVALPVRSREPIPTISEHAAPVARVLATTSMAGGTPRSSGEFYSLSNNSSETLASEYVAHPFMGGARRPPPLRRGSVMNNINLAKLPESLMMGYAQVQGSFTLDGSLVNLGPFEAVKRKAVVGGQGGGVIGVESSRRSSGFLNGFGWGGLGNSLGELLGGNEFSSMKDLRGAAGAKSIPLLSTPQSILFVDLQLAPGESKTYEYSFKLPKGLPPSHRGKAIKITYTLVVGTQRAGGAKEQQVRSVDIPFRVLGSVNSYGEILGHDLQSPYILLRDQAKVLPHEKEHNTSISKKRAKPDLPESTMNDFLSYVDELLDRPRDGMGLLSPTATAAPSRRSSFIGGEANTAKQAIDLAIMRSNMSSDSGQSTNRFSIARNGKLVGVIMLARPAYRLGETVTMAIDFTGAEIPCYAVHAALETSEHVDPSLALRSEASVHRVTRKNHASSSEATLFARRFVFTPTIPISATPEFMTSGLTLEWKIRVEFVVPSGVSADADNSSKPDGAPKEGHPLLEEILHNDKSGLILVAAENLECEGFEVAVPLRVYGALCSGLERLERDEALEEGLVV
ncbi:Rgp1-domain-containing protein [Astrocystis sublimbata]|nr:Rgp1-domain-containing protein [Astrocystis sublimbata]